MKILRHLLAVHVTCSDARLFSLTSHRITSHRSFVCLQNSIKYDVRCMDLFGLSVNAYFSTEFENYMVDLIFLPQNSGTKIFIMIALKTNNNNK